MNDRVGILIGIIIGAGVITLAWLYSYEHINDYITAENFHKAEKLCENNKGLKQIKLTGMTICNNGAQFDEVN